MFLARYVGDINYIRILIIIYNVNIYQQILNPINVKYFIILYIFFRH